MYSGTEGILLFYTDFAQTDMRGTGLSAGLTYVSSFSSFSSPSSLYASDVLAEVLGRRIWSS